MHAFTRTSPRDTELLALKYLAQCQPTVSTVPRYWFSVSRSTTTPVNDPSVKFEYQLTAFLSMTLTRDDYVAVTVKSPKSGTYPPSSPLLDRQSHDSDDGSLRALEISEGPLMAPVSYSRYAPFLAFGVVLGFLTYYGVAARTQAPVLNFSTIW